jgi:hypothetical protein
MCVSGQYSASAKAIVNLMVTFAILGSVAAGASLAATGYYICRNGIARLTQRQTRMSINGSAESKVLGQSALNFSLCLGAQNSSGQVAPSQKEGPEPMSKSYIWSQLYAFAILETDPRKLPLRIREAEWAIQERFFSTMPIDLAERQTITGARVRLKELSESARTADETLERPRTLEQPSTTMHETAGKSIPSLSPHQPEKVQIAVGGGD